MAIDLLFVGIAIYGFYVGFSRGIIKTIISVLSIIVGIIAALRFAPKMTDLLKELFNEQSPLMFVAGLILTFLLTMTILRIVGKGLEGILQTANINFINQILGGVFMAASLVFLYSLALWFVIQVMRNPENSQLVVDSRTYPFLKEYPSMVFNGFSKLKPVIQDFWDYTIDLMDEFDSISNTPEDSIQIYDLPEEEYDARRQE
jgi:membrane protein required for colicin V production